MSLGSVPVLGFVPPPPPLLPPPVPFPGVGTPVPGLPQRPTPVPGLDFLEPFGLPPYEPPAFQPSGVPRLPLPSEFPVGAIDPGPEVVPFIPAGFEGGQCNAQPYIAVVSWLNDITGARQTFSSTVFGPLSGVRIQKDATGTNVLEVRARGRRASQSCTALPTSLSELSWFGVASSAGARSDAKVDTLTPCGFEDLCGDPPPVQEGERRPNPARNFVPSPLFEPIPSPNLPPSPFPQIDPPASPESEPDREPRRIPGPPFLPSLPGELVPALPSTIPGLPEFPTLPPALVPPSVPLLPPLRLPPFRPVTVPPTVPTRPGLVPPLLPELDPSSPGPPTQPPPERLFPPLPPGEPTRQTPPAIVVIPPPVRIPPPVVIDCCAVPEVVRQGGLIRRLLEELADRLGDGCTDLCDPAVMLDVQCSGGLGLPIETKEQAVTVLNLADGLGRLSRQVFEIAKFLNICDTFSDDETPAGGPCPPGVISPPVYSGVPPGSGQDVALGDPPEGSAWVGAIARYVPAAGVGVIPSPSAPSAAYTQVVGNLALRYGSISGEARQVRSEWLEALRPQGAPYPTGVYVSAIPQCFVTIFPVSVTIE